MAKQHALSRTAEFPDVELGLGSAREAFGRKGKERQREAPTGAIAENPEETRIQGLRAGIARTPKAGEIRNEQQDRRYKIMIERYEAMLCRAEDLRIALHARLEAGGVTPEGWPAFIERPADFKERRIFEGQPSFQKLARDYVEQRARLQAEQGVYEQAVSQLGLIHTETRVTGARARKIENPALRKTEGALAATLRDICLVSELTLDQAIQAHTAVVTALSETSLPNQDEALSPDERRCAILVHHLYTHIEGRVDRLRVKMKRELDVCAKRARLAEESGRTEVAVEQRRQLQVLLGDIAPLYAMGEGFSEAAFVANAERFFLDHAQARQLAEWSVEALPEQKAVFESSLDVLRPHVFAERGMVFPFGPTLASAPLEAYVQAK